MKTNPFLLSIPGYHIERSMMQWVKRVDLTEEVYLFIQQHFYRQRPLNVAPYYKEGVDRVNPIRNCLFNIHSLCEEEL